MTLERTVPPAYRPRTSRGGARVSGRSAAQREKRQRPVGRQLVSPANRAAVLIIAVAFASWTMAVRTMSPKNYTDLGLISATNGWYWVALLSAVLGFVVAVRARHFRWYVAALGVAALIAVLYATPSVIEHAIRVEATYRHVGIADSLARTGTLERNLDAYFNWPGFFALMGMIQGSAHAPELLGVARWGPAIAAAAYVAPTLLIARALTPQPRVQWLTVFGFLAVNWTGQDYFAPQTMAFWLMLCIAGIVMTIMRRKDDPDAEGPSARIRAPRGRDGIHRLWVGDEGVRVRLSRAQWRTVHVLLFVMIGACIASHQLTPPMLVLVLFALWLVGRSPHWWLWFGAGALILVWLAFPARPFVTGHLADLTGGLLGQKPEVPVQDSNLSGRVGSGSADHNFVVNARMAATLVVWMIAGFGTLMLISERRRIRGVVLLAGMPFGLIPLQAYGGEMLIRAYLFGLPLVAFLMAAFLFQIGQRTNVRTSRPGAQWWRGAVVFAILAALASGTVLTRFGNERAESFTPHEVMAYDWLFKNTPDGSAIEQMTPNSPHVWHRYATDLWMYSKDPAPGADWSEPMTPSSLLEDIVKNGDSRPNAYVVYTRGQQSMAELMGNIKRGGLEQVGRALDKDPRYRLVYRNPDASIWKVVVPT